MKTIYSTLLVMSISIQGFTQLAWNLTLGGNGHDDVYDAVATHNGQLLLVGETSSSDLKEITLHGMSDAWLVMLDANGKMLWHKNYGLPGLNKAKASVQLADGSFVIAGTVTNSIGTYPRTNYKSLCWLFKVDIKGELIWSYIGNEGDARAITLNADGNIIAAFVQDEYLEFRMEENTAALLTQDAAIPDESDIEKSKENLNQPITQTGSLNTCFVLISDDGHLIHQLNTGNNGSDQAYHLVSDAEGNAYASGLSYNSENKSSQVWLTKLNNKCKEEWTEYFGNAGINLGGKMDISTWGYLQVPLMVSKSGAIMCDHEYDFTLMQYDKEGTMLGYNCYGDKEIELPRMVATAPDGSTWLLGDVLLAEDNEDGRLAQHDTWLRQLDIDGEAIVAAHTYTEVEELATDLAFLPGKVVTIANRMTKVNDVAYRKFEDNVYITCLTTQPTATSNTPLLQLIEPMDLIMDEFEQVITQYTEPEQEEKSTQYDSGQNGSLEVRLYPNPTRNAIAIMANAMIKEVRIMSSTGCMVQSDAVAQNLQVEIDTNELAAGTYIIEIVTEDGTEVKRLVVE